MIDLTKLQEHVAKGIENFKAKHGKKINRKKGGRPGSGEPLTNYQVQKLAGLQGKTMDAVIASGGITVKTLYKMGVGVGKYKGSEISIVIRVLKDMDGK